MQARQIDRLALELLRPQIWAVCKPGRRRIGGADVALVQALERLAEIGTHQPHKRRVVAEEVMVKNGAIGNGR